MWIYTSDAKWRAYIESVGGDLVFQAMAVEYPKMFQIENKTVEICFWHYDEVTDLEVHVVIR